MTRQIAPDHHDHHDDHDHGVVEPATVVVERHEEPVVEKPSRVGPFLAGVLTTLVAGAVALIVFLAVSDSDDDGNINVDVPAVDVDIDRRWHGRARTVVPPPVASTPPPVVRVASMNAAPPEPATHDSIDVIVPARTELASTVRLLAASFGADAGFSVDEIDDLRLALNESFTSAVESGEVHRVAVSFVPGDGTLELRISTVPTVPIQLDDLAGAILASVVDDLTNEGGVITFTKAAREPQT